MISFGKAKENRRRCDSRGKRKKEKEIFGADVKCRLIETLMTSSNCILLHLTPRPPPPPPPPSMNPAER